MKTIKNVLYFTILATAFTFGLRAQSIDQQTTGQPDSIQYTFKGLSPSQAGAFFSHLWWFGDNQFSFEHRPTTVFPAAGTYTVFAAPTENYGTGGPPPKTAVSNPTSGAQINSRVLGSGNSLKIQHYRNAVPDDTLYLLLTYALPSPLISSATFSGSIDLITDQQVQIASSYINNHPEFYPNAEIFDQNKSWKFSDLRTGEERTILIPIEVNGAYQEVVTFQAFLNIDGYEMPPSEGVSQYSLRIPVTESHDPNFMLENSEAERECDFGGEPIRYKVHFQNVGDTTTKYVQVQCHLDSKLNISTLSDIQLPKEYQNAHFRRAPLNNAYVPGAGPIYSYDETNHVLTFEFNDLVLRTTQDPTCKDLDLTRSSVEFTIRVLPNYKFGPAIVSQASIIFDNNPPITTNEVSTVCMDPMRPGGFYRQDSTIQAAEQVKQAAEPLNEENTHIRP